MKFGFDGAAHERWHPLRSFIFRFAICAAVTGFAWYANQWIGVLVTLMLWGRVFAPDLAALGVWVVRQVRGAALADVSGAHYAFKGVPVRVFEDDLQALRWIAVDDLAAALDEPISESGLRLRHAGGLRAFGGRLCLSDEAALAYLAQRQGDRALRLQHWVRREIWHPARQRHGR